MRIFFINNNLFLVLSLLNRYESIEILFFIHLSCSFKPLERNIFKKCMLIIHSFYKAAIPSFFCSYKNHKLIIILFSFFEREIAFLCEWIIFGYNFKNWCSKFRNLIEVNKKIKFLLFEFVRQFIFHLLVFVYNFIFSVCQISDDVISFLLSIEVS